MNIIILLLQLLKYFLLLESIGKYYYFYQQVILRNFCGCWNFLFLSKAIYRRPRLLRPQGLPKAGWIRVALGQLLLINYSNSAHKYVLLTTLWYCKPISENYMSYITKYDHENIDIKNYIQKWYTLDLYNLPFLFLILVCYVRLL